MASTDLHHDEYAHEEEEWRRWEMEQAEADEIHHMEFIAAEEEDALAWVSLAEQERLPLEAEWAAIEAMRDREAADEEERQIQEAMALSLRMEVERQHQEEEERRWLEEEAARLAKEDAERRAEVARREAVILEETTRREKEAETLAKRLADEAEKRAREETAAREDAQRRLKAGIRPIERPTDHEVAQARQKYQYAEGVFHIAIVGLSGTGKSSLINAFRGISNKHPDAAKTGIVETTTDVVGYSDHSTRKAFAWYDVPGAGTLDVPDWQYFKAQELYAFDCIVILFDVRFTATDVAILQNCEQLNIPSFIVRSKSNQHIDNLVRDMYKDSNVDEDDEDDYTPFKSTAEQLSHAQDRFVEESQENVRINLEKAGLAHRRVYVVSKEAMLAIVTDGRVPFNVHVIHEQELLQDITLTAERHQIR